MGCKNPPWAREELTRRGLQPLLRLGEVSHEEVCVGKEQKRGLRTQLPEKVKLSVASETFCQKSHDDVALVALLKACTKHKDLYKGIQIHDDILKRGLLKKNIFIGNTLV
eukprot:c17576_g1_i1 orf=536-865(+)